MTPPPALSKEKTIDFDQKYIRNQNVTEPPLPLLADVICERSLSYHLESLQIIDKFYFKSLGIFLNMANIFVPDHKKWKDFSSSLNFYHHDLVMLCVLLNFHCTIFFSQYFPSCRCSIFVNANGRPDMLIKKVLNEKKKIKKNTWMKISYIYNENIFYWLQIYFE